MNITIKPLSPSLAGDFLKFFDNSAFPDNPEWSGCYCGFYHFAEKEWDARTAAENRAFAQKAVNSGAMRGYLAYLGAEPIGWVNANSRAAYARLAKNKELPPGENILSVVCFIVAPECRGLGVATKLLSAVTENAYGKFDYVEAYPVKNTGSPALCYHGPLSMYEKGGFVIVREFNDYWIVRKLVKRHRLHK